MGGMLGKTKGLVPAEIARLFPAESEDLGVGDGGVFALGVAPGVNDESARLVFDFQPTRYELGVLARHYIDEARGNEYFWELTDQVGSSEVRMNGFACRRLKTIENLLGEEDFKLATAGQWEKWDEKMDQLLASPRCERCGVRHEQDGDCLADDRGRPGSTGKET